MGGSGETTGSPLEDPFDNLYEGYRGKIYRVILRLVQNRSDAEDLTHETFVKVQKNLPHVRRPDSVPSWLYRIATNTALDFLRQSASRKNSYVVHVPMEDAPAATPSPALALDSAESASAVRDNADQLP